NKIINEAEDRVEAKVTSTQKIDHKTSLHVQNFLKKRYDAKDVILNESVDNALLGGLKIEVNNEVIDFSMKNKIRKLQDHLTTS
ncbi:MAG TPA: F0F1 ATP synthase subunit delta, partial [Candidatus Paceibacterota bacterium]|nr:F0F1 ATP synthase subunit delta [Candidatus Paceibacterota bacterium]